MIGQAMTWQYSTDSCISCGRIEIVMRGCPCTNQPYRCTACRDKQVAKQQITVGKLHIAKHKLPLMLVMRVYRYVDCHKSHGQARRRFLLAIILQGKGNTHTAACKCSTNSWQRKPRHGTTVTTGTGLASGATDLTSRQN